MLDYKLSSTANKLKLGKYKHYKGHIVQVYGVANHSETLEELVVYRHIEDTENHFWVRSLKMFLETVTKDGQTIPRFAYLSKE